MPNQLNLSPSSYNAPKKETWKTSPSNQSPTRVADIVKTINFDQETSSTSQEKAFGLVSFNLDSKAQTTLRQGLGSLTAPTNLILYDAGDVKIHEGDIHGAQKTLQSIVAALLSKKVTPLIIGNNPEFIWGSYLGQSEVLTSIDWAFVNCAPCSGISKEGPYEKIHHDHLAKDRKFDYALLGVQAMSAHSLDEIAIVSAEGFHLGGAETSLEIVEDVISRSDAVALSLSLDVFAAPFVPTVTHPQPLGIFPWHLIPALRLLAASGKVSTFGLNTAGDETFTLVTQLLADFLRHTIPQEER